MKRLQRKDLTPHTGRLVVWFSCGAASAAALKLVAHLKPLAVYCNTLRSEHPDNARFMQDVERWTGIKVDIISGDYETVEDVFEKFRYMSGPRGAVCTGQLKKVPRFRTQRPTDIHIFGYTADETAPYVGRQRDRIRNFIANNPELQLAWPLVQAGITKQRALDMVKGGGIRLPAMYALGFDHNNCLGCVKSTSPAYWNRVRQHFPNVFQKRVEQSRRIGCRLVELHDERIFLDELPPEEMAQNVEDLSCGPHCHSSLNP